MVYLDWAAGAPRDSEILNACVETDVSYAANPSSLHAGGRSARDRLEEARSRTAHALGVESNQVVFTSGASESNNLVMSSLLLRESRGNVVVSALEHASVYEPCNLLGRAGFEIREISQAPGGRIDPESVLRKIDSRTVLIAIMHVNNETGCVQPVEEIVAAIRSNDDINRRIHIHTDLVQSIGRLPNALSKLDFDSASISGHKLGAPRGAGVLILRKKLEPIYRGGGHESGRRPGTENLFAIWGTMLALERHASRTPSEIDRRKWDILHDAVEDNNKLRMLPFRSGVAPPAESYSPFILSCAAPPLPGEVLVRALSDRGYMVSTGAACTTHSVRDNRVLTAMGVPTEVSDSSIRVSWGPDTDIGLIESFAGELASIAEQLAPDTSP